MPNWCDNDLTVSGPPAAVRDLLGQVGLLQDPPRFDFNQVIPYPARYAAMDAEWTFNLDDDAKAAFAAKYGVQGDGFNNGGYDWCVEHWGTKWNGDVVRENEPGSFTFQTAWAPPLPVIIALGALYPDVTLTLEYYECGMGYQGKLQVEGGVVTANLQEDYSGERGG